MTGRKSGPARDDAIRSGVFAGASPAYALCPWSRQCCVVAAAREDCSKRDFSNRLAHLAQANNVCTLKRSEATGVR